MNRRFAVFASIALLTAATIASASTRGRVAAMLHDSIPKDLYVIEIVAINGQEAQTSHYHWVSVGEVTVSVRLKYNPHWGDALTAATSHPETKDLVVNVHGNRAYYIGAKVDLQADEAAQKSGDFWAPVIAEEYTKVR